MCGIAGLVRRGRLSPGDAEAVARMTGTIAHRGPDGEGLLERRQVALGHRRLAVIDLTDRAGQPMVSVGADVSIVYNGEVYNHRELRRELEAEGHRFGSRSDSEVVLEGYRAWGAGLPARLNGMFAFAVWDDAARTLFLARDRYGQKPLYYLPLPDGGLAFASELRALREVPGWKAKVDRRGVAKYLAFDCFPGASAPLEGVKKLRPGECLTWRDGRYEVQRYWQRRYGGSALNPRDAAEELWQLLRAAVLRHTQADVPLGVFLSGGIDSSAVLAALAAETDPARIRTFSIGFRERSYDESGYARALARQLGVEHHEQVLSGDRLLELVPTILDHMDEPLADVSLVPTYALSRFARNHVTVALGGDGGDELFAGYDTFLAERLAAPYLWVPGPVRGAVAALVDRLPPSGRNMSWQFRARRFVRGLDADPLVRNQRWFGSFLPEEAAALVCGGPDPAGVYEDLQALERPEGEDAVLELWTSFYLPDDVLTKVDRASMAVALEVRAPLLDAELAAFAHSLPFHYKLRGLTRKWIFKRALKGRLPSSVLRRPKKGFGAPGGEWLRGPLRPELERLLDPQRLSREGLLQPGPVARMVQEHLSGAQDHRKQLWALFVLERWRERSGVGA